MAVVLELLVQAILILVDILVFSCTASSTMCACIINTVTSVPPTGDRR